MFPASIDIDTAKKNPATSYLWPLSLSFYAGCNFVATREQKRKSNNTCEGKVGTCVITVSCTTVSGKDDQFIFVRKVYGLYGKAGEN